MPSLTYCHSRISRSSVQFSRSVVSDSLRPHESQHARPLCPSPTPGVHSDSRPSSPWCHPADLILRHRFFLLSPIPPSIRVFSNESTLPMRWPKYWSFSFSVIPSKEHPGLIFRMDWLGLLAVQGTLKSLPQHHSSKASILRRSAFFTWALQHNKNACLTWECSVTFPQSYFFLNKSAISQTEAHFYPSVTKWNFHSFSSLTQQ